VRAPLCPLAVPVYHPLPLCGKASVEPSNFHPKEWAL
jgi:hypothetical protein